MKQNPLILMLGAIVIVALCACDSLPQADQAILQAVSNYPATTAVARAASSVPVKTAPQPQDMQVPIDELVFSGQAFDPDGADGMTFLPDGLGQESSVLQSTYTSPALEAPIPFNALVPEWIADLPETTSITVELRTGTSLDTLGEWIEAEPVQDWMQPGDLETVGEMLMVPEADGTHTFAQYRLTLLRESTDVEPLLRELRLVFLDSTAGPTAEEMIIEQKALNEQLGLDESLVAGESLDNPKPFVISRDVWCTNPDCDYTDGLEYEPVTHLILHHTVSSTGADGDSAAVVRAIWAYHTYTRGWGDIGYNFLVDTKGVLYEGHLGGDDVVGTHAAGANAGTMALALIGAYSTIQPPEPMLDSVVDMFSWKAEQRGIDVFDASNTLPNIPWGLPNLMGHRDVYGTTECPGDIAHALLPEIRNRVAERIGLVSPYFYVDELSSSFTKSTATWYDGTLQCGYNAHSWYATSTTNPGSAANWGEWRPLIPENGRYEIQSYAPYCNTGRAETEGAQYTITTPNGTSTAVVNQNEELGLWTSLGEFDLPAGNSTVVRLTNLTTTDSGVSVWFDALRLRPLEALPEAKLISPPDGTQATQRDIEFTWQIENPDKVKATILQVATDSDFKNRIVNDLWASPVLSAAHSFDKDYPELFWRVTVTSAANNEYTSDINTFAIDSGPPVSAVNPPVWLAFSERYLLSWSGEDAGSGIKSYTIDVRSAVAGAEWQVWLQDVQALSALFTPPDPQDTYEFRSQATDLLGNIESAHATADTSTSVAVIFANAVVLPIVAAD